MTVGPNRVRSEVKFLDDMMRKARAENPKKGTAQRGAAGGYNLTKTVEQERRFGRDQAR